MSIRSYTYRITLMLYSGRIERHYVKAYNRHDASLKAHRFAVPIAMSGMDGVQFINVQRMTKQECIDYNIKTEEV